MNMNVTELLGLYIAATSGARSSDLNVQTLYTLTPDFWVPFRFKRL